MTRLHLDLPAHVSFETELTIAEKDINAAGHVGHDRVLTLMQEARTQLFRHLGFADETRLEGPIGYVIADALVIYKSESFLDEVIYFKLATTDFNKYGFDIYYQLINKTTGREIARSKTGIVCFDYDARKIAPVPVKLMDQLESLS